MNTAAEPARPLPADPWRRLMSAIYESVILFGVVFFFGYGYSALTQYKGTEGALRTGFQLFLFVVLGVYFVWFWSHGRWTLPMKTMGIGLVDVQTGAPLSYGRAGRRYLVASLMFWGLLAATWKASVWWLLAWPVPFAWSIFSARRQTLYDLLSGTMLVRIDPQHRYPRPDGDGERRAGR